MTQGESDDPVRSQGQMKIELRHMTSVEVNEAVAAGRIPVLPIATLETHDPHLPVDVDTLCAEQVVLRAASARPDLIVALPPIHYGYTPHTMDFPGAFTVRPQVLQDLYYDIGVGLARNGFRRLLYLNGHGSNVLPMNMAARLVTLDTPALAAATSWWQLAEPAVRELRESAFPGGMAHACEFETSAYMHLAPELVRHDLIEDADSSMLNEWTYSDLFGNGPIHLVPWWSQTSPNGTEGAPSLATPEKGERFVACAVERLIAFCEYFRTLAIPPKQDRRPEDLRFDPTGPTAG